MHKDLKILGNGQIWDLRRISPFNPQETFEDLFSGRALGRMARTPGAGKEIFSSFKEKGRITGISVTRALLSKNPRAKETARALIEDLGRNGALGIKAFSKGEGFKSSWPIREKNYWKSPDVIIIGGGVSEGLTGKILVGSLKKYLSRDNLPGIRVYQAKFPGKEAGFLGAIVSILDRICAEAEKKSSGAITGIGLDLGREEIGVGLLAINPGSRNVILKKGKDLWLFRRSAKTPGQKHLKAFLDSRKDYTLRERRLGRSLRALILEEIVNLIAAAAKKAQELGVAASRNIAVAVPGSTSSDGYIINSTDYLPFFRKQDGFNFSKSLEGLLSKEGLGRYKVNIINDGIAAGIANAYLGLPKSKGGKFVFLGVGSGLGGCVGYINTR